SGYIISLDASCHLYNPFFCAGRGFEGPIFTNSSAQCGVEPRDICKPNFTLGYSQWIKGPNWRLGTVPLDNFRQAKLSPVLPVEISRALRPRDPKPRAKYEEPHQSQHPVCPVRVS